MSYLLEQDQDRIERDYETIEELHLEGMGDALDGRKPQQAQVPYLEGYCAGMKLALERTPRTVVLPVVNEELKEYPLRCCQCAHLENGVCKIKSVRRSGDKYACDRILVDSVF